MELTESVRLILSVFAVFRVAELFTVDDGPMNMFKKLRTYLGKIASGSVNELKKQPALLFNCPFCLGVWLSIVVAVLNIYPSSVGDIVILVFGIAGGQSLLSTISDRFGQ